MTLPDAAKQLGLAPHAGTVYNRIRREANRRQLPLGSVFENGCLTPEAERIVALIVDENRLTKPRGETVVRDDMRETLATYERLRQEHEVLWRELSRITCYLDDLETFTGQIVRSYQALEERIEALEERKRESLRDRLLRPAISLLQSRPFVATGNTLRRG